MCIAAAAYLLLGLRIFQKEENMKPLNLLKSKKVLMLYSLHFLQA